MDEIWNLNGSVSEVFISKYFYIKILSIKFSFISYIDSQEMIFLFVIIDCHGNQQNCAILHKFDVVGRLLKNISVKLLSIYLINNKCK